MNRRTWTVWLLGICLLALSSSQAQADWFTDSGGYLSEWGITVSEGLTGSPDHNTYSFFTDYTYNSNSYPVGSDTNPEPPGTATGTATVTTGTFNYKLEDTKDSATGGGYVSPYSGGQNYDLEFLGSALGGDYGADALYIAILSGIRPDNGESLFGPGDIRIGVTTPTETYYLGVEVGGGAGHTATAASEVGEIGLGADGSTYTLNGSGYTTAQTSSGTQTTGSVWKGTDTNWIADPISDGTTHYVQIKAASPGTNVGDAEYYLYSADAWGSGTNGLDGTHSVVEVVLDLSNLGLNPGDIVTSISYAPSCANDILTINPNYLIPPPSTIVPVPNSLVLLGSCLGTLALIGGWKRRRQAVNA